MGQDRSRPWRTDGSARSAPHPSTHLSPSRISAPPHTCIGSRKGSTGTMVGGSSKRTSGSRESESRKCSSWGQFRKPEHSLLRLRAQVGERYFKRRRAGNQNHVISYSHSVQRRIGAEQVHACNLTHPAACTIALDSALERPARRHADPRVPALIRHGIGDQGTPVEHALTADCSLELTRPAEPVAPLHQAAGLVRQPLAALATSVLDHASPPARAHAA
jgi:hypothetical protein